MYSYIAFAVLCVAYATAGVMLGQQQEMTMDEILANKVLLTGLNQEVEKFNLKRQNEFRVVRHSIVSATKQIWSGVVFRVKVNMIESECKNVKENDGKTIAECPAKAGKETMLCLVTVWSLAWEAPEKKLVTGMRCLKKHENGPDKAEEMKMDEVLANKELLP